MQRVRLIILLIVAASVPKGLQAAPATSGLVAQSGNAAGPPQDPSQDSKQAAAQTTQGAHPQQDKAPATDPGAALDFLGSYSAPQAVLATETGHTSARPPSATADRRLAELASDLGKVPAEPAELRTWLAGMLGAPDHSPEDWFRIGTAALEAARVDSRRLAESAAASAWNQRLEAEALSGRYPALAKSVQQGRQPGSTPAPAGQTKSAGRQPVAVRDAAGEIGRLERLPESPENLYARARLLLGVSEEAFVHASESPQLDARLYALQAIAAEEENDEAGALDEYRAGLAKYPESALLHAGLGHLFRERNELGAAQGQLDEAWRIDPTDALVGFELGDVELRMGNPAQAVTMLDRALALDPTLLVARWARGRAYLAAGGDGSDERALEDLTAAESCDRSGVLEYQIAQLYTKLGRAAEAQAAERRSQDQRRAQEQTKRPATPAPD
jgi:hypothetical protein